MINILVIVLTIAGAVTAIYVLYSLLLFNGSKDPHAELQLTTKNTIDQVDILYRKKEYELLELFATKYLDRVPSNHNVREYLAKSYFETKKINKAVSECAILLKHSPDNLEIRRLLAECYVKKEMYMDALTQFEICYQEKEDQPEVIKRLAELYVITDQLYSAINAYKLYVDMISEEVEQAEIYAILADLNERAGYYPAAFEAYKQRLTIYPNDFETNKKLGNLYIKIKNLPKALEIFEYMLTFTTDNRLKIGLLEGIIDLKTELTNYESALESANTLLEIPGVDTFKTRNTIATLTVLLGRLDEGIAILEDLAQLSQNAFDVTMELAMAYRQHKNYKLSLDKYKELLDAADQKEAREIRNKICELYVDWAMKDSNTSKFDEKEAVKNLSNAMQYDALNPNVYYNFALVSMKGQNYNDAVSYLLKAIEFAKNNEELCNFYIKISECHHSLGNVFEEKKALSDLLTIDDENAVGHMKMGILYQTQQDLKNAEDSLLKAISLNDSLLDAKYYLALIYENSDKERANKLYHEILEQDPRYVNAINALTEVTLQDS